MRYFLVFFFSIISTITQADWHLDANASSLSYVSIKKNEIGEINYFKKFNASITSSGMLNMQVDLSSVDTRYAIRDERMRKMFFETSNFPNAIIKGKVPVEHLEKMSVGQAERVPVNVTLDLHGHSDKVETILRLFKMNSSGFMVTTESPILLNVQAFDLTEGLQRLLEAAELSEITWVVPVSFVLVFE